jgi:uncharacterized protein DUF4238
MKSNTAQHFVPRFYLRGWADNRERLWSYRVGGQPPVNTTVSKVAFERGLYTHPDGNGLSSIETEQDLAKLESLYAPVWPGVIDQAGDLSTRKNLASFVALMAVRNPNFEVEIGRLHATLRTAVSGLRPNDMVEVVGRNGKTASCSVREVLNGTLPEKQTMKASFLRAMRQQVEPIAEALITRRWGVIVSDGGEFLTSDAPVVLSRAECTKVGFGFGTPGTLVLFPISPFRMLAICDEWNQEFAHYKDHETGLLNPIIATHAVRFIYGRENVPALPAQIKAWRSE